MSLTDDQLQEISRWLLVADRDFNMAESNQDSFPENSAYMYQQSIEKNLKAFLILNDYAKRQIPDLFI